MKLYRTILVTYATSPCSSHPQIIQQCITSVENDDNFGPMAILNKIREQYGKNVVLVNYWEL